MLETQGATLHCEDCGRERVGVYCHHCGQRHGKHDLSLRHVMTDVVRDLTHWDARVLTTLRLLVFHPGQLTCAYLAGRRTRYVPPLRLYIFLSFLLFLVLGMAPAHFNVQGRTSFDGGSATEETRELAPAPKGSSEAELPKAMNDLNAKARKALHEPEVFQEHLIHWSSHAMFVLLPLFAGLLALLFLGSRRYFVEHVIFSIHVHSFAFLLFLAEALLNLLPWKAAGSLGSWLLLALPVYLGVALKRVYGEPVWKILLKGAVLSGVYLGIALAALVTVVVLVLKA